MRRGEVKEAHLLDPPVHLRLTEVAVVDVSWATGAEARVLPEALPTTWRKVREAWPGS